MAKRSRTDEPIGRWLPRLASEHGYSLRQLADAIGVDQSYLSRIKSADTTNRQWRPPSLHVLEQLAQVFDLEPDYFPEYRRRAVEEAIAKDPKLRDRLFDTMRRKR